MSKSAKSTAQKKEISKHPIIPEKYQDIIYILFLAILVFIFFGGAIFSGGFNVSDNIASVSFRPFIAESNKQGVFPLWMPYIFGGMPGYAALLVQGARVWDIMPQFVFGFTELIGSLFGSDLARVLTFYVILAAGIYLLMRFKQHSRFVAFFTAFATAFSTSVILWPMIGHNTKPIVYAMFPYIFLLLEKLREKFSLIYTVLLIFAVHVMNEGSHLQMIFYGICAFGLYLLFELVSRIITKREPLKVIRSALILAVAGGISFMMSADRYLSTIEYTPYSTRGSQPIIKSKDSEAIKTGGQDYDYATMWSFSPQEIATFFIPNYFGFGQLPYKGTLTGGNEIKMRSYWGQKPFEDAAPYMGIIVIGLAVIGFIVYRRDVFVQFLFFLSLFALFLSFGKNLPIIYDLFYYYVPGFNKFRAPSMTLALLQFAVPLLSGFGLTSIIKWRQNDTQEGRKLIKFVFIASVAFFIVAIIFNLVFKDSYLSAVSESNIYKEFSSNYGTAAAVELQSFIWNEMISDWYLTAVIAMIAALLIYLFSKKKIKGIVFYPFLTFLLIFDLWRVAYRPMDYSERSIEEEVFRRTDIIDFIKQDNSIYRVADFASPSPNVDAYHFLENINGYHSAKLRVYQDLLDVANMVEPRSTSNLRNTLLWNIMNVKYIITDKQLSYNGYLMLEKDSTGNNQLKKDFSIIYQSKQNGNYVIRNDKALPRAFFVDSVAVSDKMTILTHIKTADFEPSRLAYIEEKLPVGIEAAGEGSSVKILSKKEQYMKIEAIATGKNLLFIGEVYYPAGWRAYIDGKETPIYKTNFAFRSIIVPEGKHIVELKFYSEKFQTGKMFSIVANIVTILALAIGIFFERKRKKKI